MSTLNESTFYSWKVSEQFFLIAFVCSIVLHLAFAVTNLNWEQEKIDKPKPIIVELIKKPAPPVAKPVKKVAPKPKPKPKKKKPKPKPKPKKKIIKKAKPVVKPVIKPVVQPAVVTPIRVPEPVIEPLPVIEPVVETPPPPMPEPEPVVVKTPEPVVEVVQAPPPGPTASEVDSALSAYRGLLQAAINKHKKYPRIAKSRGWQGRVVIQFKLSPNGNVISKSVIQSSGHKALDKAAIKMAEKAAPFPLPPKALQGKTIAIKVPIPFKLVSPN